MAVTPTALALAITSDVCNKKRGEKVWGELPVAMGTAAKQKRGWFHVGGASAWAEIGAKLCVVVPLWQLMLTPVVFQQ